MDIHNRENIKHLSDALNPNSVVNCSNIYRSVNIVKDNIEDYGLLHTIYGGANFKEYLNAKKLSVIEFTTLNNKLIDLL